MFQETIEFLSCLACQSTYLAIEVSEQDGNEILSGRLICQACGQDYPIVSGIPSFVAVQPSNGDHSPVTEKGPEVLVQQAEMRFRDKHADGFDVGQDVFQRKLEIDTVLSELDVKSNHHVLDVGCGTGLALMALIGRAEALVGVDFSMDSLQILRVKLNQERRQTVHLIHADAANLPLKAARFDRTVSVQLFQHFPTVSIRARVLRNVKRVTRDNGRFVLSVFHYSLLKRFRALMLADPSLDVYEREGLHRGQLYYHNFTVPELTALLQQTGFKPLQWYGVNTPFTRRFGRWGMRLEQILKHTPLSLLLAHWVVISSSCPGVDTNQ